MSAVLSRPSSAQQAAEAQARDVAQLFAGHRSLLQSLANSRPGMCMANGWDVTQQTLDGDFELDDNVVQRILQQGGGSSGAVLRATPPAAASGAPQSSASSAVKDYLFPPSPSAPRGTSERLGQELPGAVYGPGNVLANSTAALAGALQGMNERDVARLLQEGLKSIREGRAQRVRLSAHMELYNSAQGRQAPRVRLRVRGLPLQVISRAIPASGGPVTQWRMNGPQTAATLKGPSMTAQQMRNTAVMAGEQRLPGMLRWTQGRVGTGVLAFAPSAALDLYNATEVDLGSRQFSFNGRQFLTDSARSQSGNAIGLAGGALTVAAVGFVTAGAVAGAPLVLLGLGVGIILQVAWNTSGLADDTANLVQRNLN